MYLCVHAPFSTRLTPEHETTSRGEIRDEMERHSLSYRATKKRLIPNTNFHVASEAMDDLLHRCERHIQKGHKIWFEFVDHQYIEITNSIELRFSVELATLKFWDDNPKDNNNNPWTTQGQFLGVYDDGVSGQECEKEDDDDDGAPPDHGVAFGQDEDDEDDHMHPPSLPVGYDDKNDDYTEDNSDSEE